MIFFSQYLLQQQKKKQPPYYLFSQLGRAFTNQAIFLQPLKQKCADNGPQHRFHVLVFTLCFHIYMSGKWEDEIHCLNIISGLEMKTLIKRWIKGQQWGQAARTQTANCLAHYDLLFFLEAERAISVHRLLKKGKRAAKRPDTRPLPVTKCQLGMREKELRWESHEKSSSSTQGWKFLRETGLHWGSAVMTISPTEITALLLLLLMPPPPLHHESPCSLVTARGIYR